MINRKKQLIKTNNEKISKLAIQLSPYINNFKRNFTEGEIFLEDNYGNCKKKKEIF